MVNKGETRPRVVLVNRAVIINEKRRLLLLRRTSRDRWAAGKWEFPGGKLDEGQDVSNALEREVLEEAGLVVLPVNRLVYYESRILTDGPYAGLPYISLVGLTKIEGGQVKLSSEHEDFVWVDFETALGYDLTEVTRKALLVLKDTFRF